MKQLFLVCLLLLMSGCSLFDSDMGVAKYSAEPFESNGTIVCCKVHVYNTKDIGSVAVDFKKEGDNYAVRVYEEKIDSSTPYQIQAESTAKLVDSINQLVNQVIGASLLP